MHVIFIPPDGYNKSISTSFHTGCNKFLLYCFNFQLQKIKHRNNLYTVEAEFRFVHELCHPKSKQKERPTVVQ